MGAVDFNPTGCDCGNKLINCPHVKKNLFKGKIPFPIQGNLPYTPPFEIEHFFQPSDKPIKVKTMSDEQHTSLFGMNKEALTKKFDINGDGKLDAKERDALNAYKDEKLKAKFDINGDGIIDDKEWNALNEYKKSLDRQEKMAKFDIDGNGELDRAEQEAYAAYQRPIYYTNLPECRPFQKPVHTDHVECTTYKQ